MGDQCPTCGQAVRVVTGDEGTSHFTPAAVEEYREQLEVERLAEETGFEPGQQRQGGLPGEKATLVDHVLEQFAEVDEALRMVERERDTAVKGERELLRTWLQSKEVSEIALAAIGKAKQFGGGAIGAAVATQRALAAALEEDPDA